MTIEEIRASPVGIWFYCSKENDKIILKLSSYLIKHIYRTVKTELLVSIYKDQSKTYPMLGMRIFDNDQHPCLIAERMQLSQLSAFKKVMSSNTINVDIYDELGFPVLSGKLFYSDSICKEFSSFYDSHCPYDDDRSIEYAQQSLDAFAEAIEQGGVIGNVISFREVPIYFSDLAEYRTKK